MPTIVSAIRAACAAMVLAETEVLVREDWNIGAGVEKTREMISCH